MESSPYLEAIQNVSGKTPGEKYGTFNYVARKLISSSIGKNAVIQVQPSVELPEIMIPLVKVEIATILQQPDGIVEGLKSIDNIVFKRALNAKWFFNGSMEDITNVEYFRDRIFRFISVENRQKLIRILAINLSRKKEYTIAENFYEFLLNMYGKEESQVLLLACRESFTWDTIIKRKLLLSSNIVSKLYLNYPNLILKYLDLCKPGGIRYDQHMNGKRVYDLRSFLPRLIKNDTNVFMEFHEMMRIYLIGTLGRKKMMIILKNERDYLIKKPEYFMPILDQKLLVSELTSDEFKLLFRNLFPKSINQWGCFFNYTFSTMYDYLEYYPSDEKVPLILSTFKELYGKNFIDFDEYIDPKVLKLLPLEDRIKTARKKLETDPEWFKSGSGIASSWRCYLPTAESIPLFQNRISITSDGEQRRLLIEQMIYSCKVNNDENALVELLEYIITRHKNESDNTMCGVIPLVLDNFETQNLSIQCWNILDKIFEIVLIEGKIGVCTRKLYLIGKTHFCLLQNLPIRNPIKSYISLKFQGYTLTWNILIKYPEYERKCLEEFIEVASLLDLPRGSKLNVVYEFLKSIVKFNKRNLKFKDKIKPMTIKDYPWLITEIPELANIKIHDCATNAPRDGGLKKGRYRDLYRNWIYVTVNYKWLNLKSVTELKKWMNNVAKIKKKSKRS